MVVDPNGQVSVTYVDPHGRTVATALAGQPPAAFDPLDYQQYSTLEVDILNKYPEVDANGNLLVPVEEMPDTDLDDNQPLSTGNFPNGIADGLSANMQHSVADNSVQHDFAYDMRSEHFHDACLDRCYRYVYDLEISLKDKCGNETLFQDPNPNTSTPNYAPLWSAWAGPATCWYLKLLTATTHCPCIKRRTCTHSWTWVPTP